MTASPASSAQPNVFQPGQPFFHGRYRLERKLGQGGMGQVWQATALYSGQLVAIKMLHRQGGNFAARFRQECRFYTLLDHPNIVGMLQADEDENGVMFIVTQYLRGLTCREILDRQLRLEIPHAVHLAVQLADAGGYMHSEGIWHRDLKPENLMVGSLKKIKGHLWIIDFGIAKLANPEQAGLNTDEMPAVGSVMYMAPERADPARRGAVDGRADIYAFGCILYELITGHHIFLPAWRSASAPMIMNGHRTANIAPMTRFVPDCPPEVEAVVMRCLARDPANRYATFEPIGDALREVNRGSFPADHYISRRVQQEQAEVARKQAFAQVSLTHGTGRREPAEALGKATTAEVLPDLPARTGAATQGAKADTRQASGPRVIQETVPMGAAFVLPKSVLPFTPAAPANRWARTEPLAAPPVVSVPAPALPLRAPAPPPARSTRSARALAVILGLVLALVFTTVVLVFLPARHPRTPAEPSAIPAATPTASEAPSATAVPTEAPQAQPSATPSAKPTLTGSPAQTSPTKPPPHASQAPKPKPPSGPVPLFELPESKPRL
ncbi:MAG: protein kinase [Minicystis sp.]